MHSIRQIGAVAAISLRGLPQRIGSSFVIVIGIAGVVVVLLSFLAMEAGLAHTIANAGKPDRAIVLRKGADSESDSTLTRDAALTIATAQAIAKDADGRPIASPELLEVVSLAKKNSPSLAEVTVRGITPAAYELRPEVHLIAGRKVQPGKRELNVGRAAQLQFNGLTLNQTVALRNSEWTIVGIFTSQGDAHESEIFADADTLMSAYQSTVFQSLTVRLVSPLALRQFKEFVASTPALSASVLSEQEYYRQQSQRLGMLLTVVAYVVGGIMALGALFGAVSAMYSAVSVRTREIATLRAIGFGPVSVMISVLTESLLFAAIGASAGAALAWLVFNGNTISTLQGNGQVVAQLSIGPGLLVTGLVWACLIGLAGGIVPAIRAARLPVAAAFRAT